MTAIVAIGAVTPLGTGEAGWSNGAIGAAAPAAIVRDEQLATAGLRKPFAARALHASRADDDDRATSLLLRALAQLEGVLPKNARIGISLGTSSGGMQSAEKLFDVHARGGTIDRALADAATYHGPHRALVARLRALGHDIAREAHVLTACSASTIALGLARRWLDAGEVDVAIAGGYDALTTFVAAGFEALGATTAHPPPRPFRLGRDGMSLGEGAALFVLRRDADGEGALASLRGFGAAGDAVHLTAPDREGAGLGRAALAALDDAGVDAATIDLVSVHGTSTPFNDPMEAKAIARALSDQARHVAVHAAKASVGHTLGAAGAIETALVVDALRRGVLPATAGEGEWDPQASTGARERNEAGVVRGALKLSAAFGGANAALVVTPVSSDAARLRDERERKEARAPRVIAAVDVAADPIELAALATLTSIARDRLARMDGVCRLALRALATLSLSVDGGRDRLRGAGIVLGTSLATIDVNAVYAAGMRQKGAAHAEARRFAYTTPNAAAGECSMAFGLTGPNVAVGRGADAGVEAMEIARDLIAAKTGKRMVVIDVDAPGPMAELLATTLGWNVRFGARATLLE
ncbi:MAG: beta-ketoacyl synthase N-terminal-like domain-containing protein [Polyangiales bacterium]